MSSILVLTIGDLGTKVRLTRVALGLRQIDVAAAARVGQAEVSLLERGGVIRPGVRRKVLLALGMREDLETA